MFNNYDEFEEVNDYDEDIKKREKLLEEIKNIQVEDDLHSALRNVMDLKKRWNRISYWDSAFEDNLREEFDTYVDAFYAKRNEGYGNNQSVKEELIASAHRISLSENFKQATLEMNELMNQWKVCGSCGKAEDDRLWAAFNEQRQAFFERKKEYWETMQTRFDNAREVKKELIEKAAALKDSKEWKKTSDAYRELMDAWKGAGSAGKDFEDDLWNAFHTQRQVFYDNRTAYYDAQREKQDQYYEEKSKLVERAKQILASNEFNKDHSEQMKQLGVDWKKISNCGKEREDKIWKEFRSTMDAYFDGLKQFNDQKHSMWRQNMQDIRMRKLDMIQNQKRQIKYMEDEIVGLLGQRAIDEMQEDIADAEVFITQLEAEIADIDKKLLA